MFSKWEKHTSIEEEQTSFLSKVFVAVYLNLAVCSLIAYGRIDTIPEFLKSWYIFQGPYDDFSSDWYAEVGVFIVISFSLQCIIELLKAYGEYYLYYPLWRWKHSSAVEQMKSTQFPMQKDLNALYIGRVFDPTKAQAMLLALLFTVMTFAPGIPLLQLLCPIFFCLIFRKDKILLMRHYEKPPHAGDNVMRKVISWLPWAAVIRLCFAIWMLGDDSVLESSEMSASQAGSASSNGYSADTSSVSTGGVSSLVQNSAGNQGNSLLATMIIRGTRSNCVPLLVLLVLILATIFISYIWKLLPIFWIIRFLKCVRQVFQKKSKVHTYAEEADILASRKAAKKAKKPGSGDNEDNKEEDEEAGGTSEPPSDVLQMDKGAYLTEFEIAALNHPLRQEAAPFTDDYYHYAMDLHEDNHR